jgi:RNA polymerase sigma-70 factor (ECF subfamily)
MDALQKAELHQSAVHPAAREDDRNVPPQTHALGVARAASPCQRRFGWTSAGPAVACRDSDVGVDYSRRVEQLVSTAEMRLVDGLRAGDEAAFAELMREHGASMLRVAQLYVRSRAVAEEVVQEAWLAVFKGISRFEGRSSLKTWLFRILTNTAKTRAVREGRSIPFSALAADEEEGGLVDPDRFGGPEARFPGHWTAPPHTWAGEPEQRLMLSETLDVIKAEIDKLPPAQALVITMRDVEGFESEEVCNALGISETNQRVLLHRARTKVRRALEDRLT